MKDVKLPSATTDDTSNKAVKEFEELRVVPNICLIFVVFQQTRVVYQFKPCDSP